MSNITSEKLGTVAEVELLNVNEVTPSSYPPRLKKMLFSIES